MRTRPTVTRRRLLGGLGLLAGAGIAGVAGTAAGLLPGSSWARRHLGTAGSEGSVPAIQPGTVAFSSWRSQARAGQVELMVATPPVPSGQHLPVCLALHGRGSSARGMADLGLPQFLADATRHGLPPLAIVAPDGGDHYWADCGPGDDSMRMLRSELPGWLADLGLPAPSAVLGVSMGGFGALSYALTRRPAATALLSPALFTDWSQPKALHAFPSRSVWEAQDPLRHAEELDGTTLGIWCGSSDVYYDTAQGLARRTHPAVSAFDAGDHTPGYWRRVLPDALRFIAARAH